MQSFEQIRAHVGSQYTVTTSDPYLIALEITLDGRTRRQTIFLTELEGDDGRKYLRLSTAIAPMTGLDARRALEFNWQQRVGYLAQSKLDDAPYLQLCENRPYDGLSASEVDRLVLEIGGLGDTLERAFSAGGDLF